MQKARRADGWHVADVEMQDNPVFEEDLSRRECHNYNIMCNDNDYVQVNSTGFVLSLFASRESPETTTHP